MPVTWSSANSENTTFSNLGKTAAKSGSSGAAGISTAGVSAGQKRYWEVVYLSTTGADFTGNGSNGFLRSGGSRGNWPATKRNGYLGGGDNWAGLPNGVFTQSNNEQGYNTSSSAFGTGTVIRYAVDFDAGSWFWAVNGGSWSAATPLPANDGTIYPAYEFDAGCSDKAQIVGRFSAADQQYSRPSGFSALDPGSSSSTGTRLFDFTNATYAASISNVSASGGYAETLAGTLTTFAANTLRRTDKGLLVEPAATNVMPNSAAVGGTFSNSSGTITITNNAATAPDGTTTADRVDINRSGSDAFAIFSQDLSPPAGTYVPSIWLKARTAGDVGKQVYAVLHAGSQKAVTVITLTDAWVRYTFGSQASPTQAFIGYAESGWTGSNATGPVSFYAWGLQATINTLSSDILTSGSAATRSADAVSHTVPAGNTLYTYTFSDGSTLDVAVTPGTTHTISTAYAPLFVKYIDGNGASSGIGGSAAIALGMVAASAVSRLALQASSITALAPIVATATSRLPLHASAGVSLAPIAMTAGARLTLTAQASVALGNVAGAGTSTLRIAGSAGVPLGGISMTSTAALGIGALASVTLSPVTVSAIGTGQLATGASAAIELASIGTAAAARLALSASSAIALDAIGSAGQARLRLIANTAATLAPIGTTAIGVLAGRGVAAATLRPIGLLATASQVVVTILPPSASRVVRVAPRTRTVHVPARIRIVQVEGPAAC